MKLYYSPGTCSLAIHILLREVDADFELERVDTAAGTTASGKDFSAINPKRVVPVLELDNGEFLTEGPVIAQYITDQAQATNLMPAAGSLERYRVMEWQNTLTSEFHKGYTPLFKAQVNDEAKAYFAQALQQRYAWVEAALEDRDYLTGTHFTAPDAYLFVITNWARLVKLDLSAYPRLAAFQQRVAERPAVREAMQVEGLIKG